MLTLAIPSFPKIITDTVRFCFNKTSEVELQLKNYIKETILTISLGLLFFKRLCDQI